MTDAIRSLFELLTKKEKSGSDYTGTVTRVEGKTAYVRFDGADIDDTPVALSIGASPGDTVRIRVADGRAWLVGNDSAPPNDSSGVAYDLVRTNALIDAIRTERITGENGWINLLFGTFDYGNGKLAWNGKKLTVSGEVKTGNGEVGGWKITETQIYKSVIIGGYEYRAILNAPTSVDGTTKAIAIAIRTNDGAGNVGNWEYPLYMQYNGQIYANKAVIDNGAKIGLWTVDSGRIIYSSGTERAIIAINLLRYKSGNDITEVTHEGVKVSDNTTGAKAQAALDVSGLSIYANNVVTGKTTEYKYNRLYVWGNGTFRTGNVRTINQANAASGFFAESYYHGGLIVDLEIAATGNHGLYSNGYWNGSRYVNTGAGWMIYKNTSGAIVVNTSSDRRRKRNITELQQKEALALLRGVKPCNFVYAEDEDEITQTGMIAQDVRDVLIENGIGYRPYLVISDTHSSDVYQDITKPEDEVEYGLDYGKLTPILWAGWRHHDEELQKLHARIKSLEDEVSDLKQLILEMRKEHV